MQAMFEEFKKSNREQKGKHHCSTTQTCCTPES